MVVLVVLGVVLELVEAVAKPLLVPVLKKPPPGPPKPQPGRGLKNISARNILLTEILLNPLKPVGLSNNS